MVQTSASTRTETSYDARNILSLVFGEHYAEDIPGSDEEYMKIAELHEGGIFNSSILTIYPNPNNGIFTVVYSQAEGEQLQLFISDLNGKMLLRIPLDQDSNAIDLNLSALPVGTYLAGVTNGKISSSFRKIDILK